MMQRLLPLRPKTAGSVLLGSTLLATALVPAGPAQAVYAQPSADAVVTHSYAADSGDPCPKGYTKGTLAWHLGSAESRTVDVDGGVLDHPLTTETDPACGEDGRYTVATFTPYALGVAGKPVSVRVDNGVRRFAFPVAAVAPVERIVVQVCRISSVPRPLPEVCGRPQEYRAPLTS